MRKLSARVSMRRDYEPEVNARLTAGEEQPTYVLGHPGLAAR
jgi:hypothetical protein